MPKRCDFIHPNGKPCRRWTKQPSRFCYHHSPNPSPRKRRVAAHLHPLLRLTSPEDVFDVAREALNAVRLGRIAPGHAYALGYLVGVWLRVYKEVDIDQREEGLFRQLLAEHVEHDAAAKSARDHHPLVLSGAEPEPADPSLDEETARALTSAGQTLKAELNKDMKKAAIAFIKSAVRNTRDPSSEEEEDSAEKKA